MTLGPLPTATLAGDYDHNVAVNAVDYTVWRAAFGQSISPGSGADGNTDGMFDAAGYIVWRKNLGSGSGAFISIAEPSGWCMAIALMVGGSAVGERWLG